jgi:hypothetical protein
VTPSHIPLVISKSEAPTYTGGEKAIQDEMPEG